jgi:hypothetical protein
MLLTEDQVKNAVIAALGKRDFIPTKIRALSEHGVDITAKHRNYSRYFLVEVKGDPPNSVKNSRSGREVRFLLSVGQLITRIQPKRGYYYGLAFPATYKTMVTRRIHPTLLKELKIQLFFVDTRRNVERLTWRDVSRIQQQ